MNKTAKKTKKPLKYPRKLRHKLEKVAYNREVREAEANGEPPPLHPVMDTLHHRFLSLGKLHPIMHTRFSDDQRQMQTNWTVDPLFLPELVSIPPPWIAGGKSESEGSA